MRSVLTRTGAGFFMVALTALSAGASPTITIGQGLGAWD